MYTLTQFSNTVTERLCIKILVAQKLQQQYQVVITSQKLISVFHMYNMWFLNYELLFIFKDFLHKCCFFFFPEKNIQL